VTPVTPVTPVTSPTPPTPLTPEEFAHSLIRTTVTTDRVAAVMARIAGERIEVGPLRFGPGGAVAATGVGRIGPIQVTERGSRTDSGSGSGSGWVGFDARISGELTIDLTVGSGTHKHRYQGTVVVPLHITVVLEPPAWVVLDVEPLRPSDVEVKLQTAGVATFVLQTIGDADGEVSAQVAEVVNERVAAVAELRRIDLAALLDQAWDSHLETQLGLGWESDRAD
jgi:hypothetical protein